MNFNGKFWHKPGHLGMTTAQVKEALQGGGGGGGYDPNEPGKLMIVLTPLELMAILGGTPASKNATFYDRNKFQPYMTIGVSSDPVVDIILYATSYDDLNSGSKTFITGSYVDATDKTYFITAVCTDFDAGTFTLKAIEL